MDRSDEWMAQLGWQDLVYEELLEMIEGRQIVNAKLEDWSASYSGPKFHAVLCDPPYGLEFMGKEWDAPHKASSFPKAGNLGGFADGNKPSFARQGDISRLTDVYRSWGEAILPHLYPGALVLMFGGTRTWHRLACGMEDAGFEIWDTMMWLHGQGFPKAQDAGALLDTDACREAGLHPSDPEERKKHKCAMLPQHDTWRTHKTTALKPAWEPVLCFKKPLTGTYAEMALQYGSGALNVDGGRIGVDGGYETAIPAPRGSAATIYGKGIAGHRTAPVDGLGRYPANLILDETSAALLDEQTGDLGRSSGGLTQTFGNNIFDGFKPMLRANAGGLGDSGGASRFYYCAKASSSERNAGLEEMPFRDRDDVMSMNSHNHEGGIDGRGKPYKISPTRNHHPTVKPIDLCRYLATLLLPPDSVKPRRLLVPFAGSGSEMIGAMLAGWDEIVGVEQDKEHGYVPIAEARLDWWQWAMTEARITDPMAILRRFGFADDPPAGQPNLFEKKPEQMTL